MVLCVTSPNVDLIGRLLSKVELVTNHDGWTQPPTFWLLFDASAGDTASTVLASLGSKRTVRHKHYNALRIAALPADADPADAVRALANNIALHPDADEVRFLMRGFRTPGFLGFALAIESGHAQSSQGIAAALGQNRAATEAALRATHRRAVWACDRDNRMHLAERARGDAAAQLHTCVTSAGHNTTTLKIMVDAVLGQTPQDQASWDARYPTLQQAVRGGAAG